MCNICVRECVCAVNSVRERRETWAECERERRYAVKSVGIGGDIGEEMGAAWGEDEDVGEEREAIVG